MSSDLVAAAVMKPVGSFVHLRRGTVNLQLVKWLCVGSIPSAFGGVLLLKTLGTSDQVQHTITLALGIALLLAAAGLIVRPTCGSSSGLETPTEAPHLCPRVARRSR